MNRTYQTPLTRTEEINSDTQMLWGASPTGDNFNPQQAPARRNDAGQQL